MSKEELVKLLESLKIPITEGPPDDDEVEEDARINFWDYDWLDNVASGTEYNTIVTYQISFVANIPRHPKLLELKRKLNEKGLHPEIQHEHLIEKRRVHSFFSMEVIENIGDDLNGT